MSDQRKRSRRQREKRAEVVVFAPTGEPVPERKLRCNQSRLKLRTRGTRVATLRHPFLPEDV